MKKILLFLLFIIFLAGQMPMQAGVAASHFTIENQPRLADFQVSLNGQEVRITLMGLVAERVTIEIYSMTGQRISFTEMPKSDSRTYDFSLDMPLRKGLYIVKVSSGSQVIAKKLNVQ